MNAHKGFFLSREIRNGFFSPLDSLKFFAKHKGLLFIGVAPQILGIAAYCYFLNESAVIKAQEFLVRMGLLEAGVTDGLAFGSFQIAFYVLAILLYALLGLPIVSTIASPLYDLIAQRAYTYTSGIILPKDSLAQMLRSFVSEIIKLVIIYAAIFLSWINPVFVPIGMLFSLWFLGWDQFDRTLALLHYPLRRRFAFGFKHGLSCISLGLWFYIPFAGSLMAFTFAAAGAIAVANVQSSRERDELKQISAQS
jgi:hypothetical protein